MAKTEFTVLKTCTKCGVEKPVSEYHKHSNQKSGLAPYCKCCKRIATAAYREANPEKCRAASAAWDAANKDKRREIKEAWRSVNRAKVNAESAAYRAANPEKIKAAELERYRSNPEAGKARVAAYRSANPNKAKEYAARYREEYPEKTIAASAAWRLANPEKVRASVAAWSAANPEALRVHVQNRRARKANNGGRLSTGLAKKLFLLQRGKCPCCNQPLGSDCHLDHKMPLALGGGNTDDNMQLLRSICNQQKHAKHPVDFMQSRGFLL